MDEEVKEEQPQPKKDLPGESYTFDLVAHPYLLDQRAKVKANPHEHLLYEGLHHLRKFLLGIDDYDLVRKVCRIEETDYEHKGIGTLIGLPNVPQPHWLPLKGEEYQDFLSHVEKLMLMWIGSQDRRSPLYPLFYREYQNQNQSRWPYAILIYVLALIPLGAYARYIGHGFLDYAWQREKDSPGMDYVREVCFIADHFYQHWEEQEKKGTNV